jgi:hypothetical protein
MSLENIDLIDVFLKKNFKRRSVKFEDETYIELSIFDIPLEIIANYKVNAEETINQKLVDMSFDYFNKGLTCRLCNMKFDNRDGQLLHFKSLFHNANIKRSLNNIPILTSEVELNNEEIKSSVDIATTLKNDNEREVPISTENFIPS